jgi:metallo-beta-lactamase family protein
METVCIKMPPTHQQEFYKWIEKTCIKKKGKLIIPAFSVGRTQELLYFLNDLSLNKLLTVFPFLLTAL